MFRITLQNIITLSIFSILIYFYYLIKIANSISIQINYSQKERTQTDELQVSALLQDIKIKAALKDYRENYVNREFQVPEVKDDKKNQRSNVYKYKNGTVMSLVDSLEKTLKRQSAGKSTKSSNLNMNSLLARFNKLNNTIAKQNEVKELPPILSENCEIEDDFDIKTLINSTLKKEVFELTNSNIKDACTYSDVTEIYYPHASNENCDFDQDLLPDDFKFYIENEFKELLLERNLKPWPILESSPEKTLLPLIHVPKTGGSSFYEHLKDWALSENYPYTAAFYPNLEGIESKRNTSIASYHSPGCRSSHSWGATHCSYSELHDCFDKDLANLKKSDQNLEQTQTQAQAQTSNFYSSKFRDQRKYFAIIRHPITRVLSEFWWWREKCVVQKLKTWPDPLCRHINNLKDWILSPYNNVHNPPFPCVFSFLRYAYNL